MSACLLWQVGCFGKPVPSVRLAFGVVWCAVYLELLGLHSFKVYSVFKPEVLESFPEKSAKCLNMFSVSLLLGRVFFVLLVTCCELRRNYCRSQSCSQTGSAAFYHSSSLPAFLKENELFGSPPPMEKVLWRIGLQENFSWGSFCWWDGFWGEVGR